VLMYKSALAINPDTSIHNNLGVAYYMSGKNDLAIEEYKKAIQLNPVHIDAHNNLGIAYESIGKKDEALSEYKKACDLGYKDACR
ncbi:tetratricopeptide repeat protein, partial [bacterium]